MKKKKKEMVVDEYPKVVETFYNGWSWGLSQYKGNHLEPSAFNGNVNIRRYRVTVELIDEPIEVLQERLEKLWVECDNWHHHLPLQNAASKIGYTFKGERGSAKKQKTSI